MTKTSGRDGVGEYFKQLMNVENEGIEGNVTQKRRNRGGVSRMEEKSAVKRKKKGKAVGLDDTPVEAWKCLGDEGIDWLTKLFNSILNTEEMSDEWEPVP